MAVRTGWLRALNVKYSHWSSQRTLRVAGVSSASSARPWESPTGRLATAIRGARDRGEFARRVACRERRDAHVRYEPWTASTRPRLRRLRLGIRSVTG